MHRLGLALLALVGACGCGDDADDGSDLDAGAAVDGGTDAGPVDWPAMEVPAEVLRFVLEHVAETGSVSVPAM